MGVCGRAGLATPVGPSIDTAFGLLRVSPAPGPVKTAHAFFSPPATTSLPYRPCVSSADRVTMRTPEEIEALLKGPFEGGTHLYTVAWPP